VLRLASDPAPRVPADAASVAWRTERAIPTTSSASPRAPRSTRLKKQFRARAKALHPDTSDGTASEDAFHELKAAYETLLERRGAESDPQDEVYGPGMRARLNAARAWRERSASKASGVAPAREWSEINQMRHSRAAAGRAFDAESRQTLDELLAARRAARASASPSMGARGSFGGELKGGRSSRAWLGVGVGCCLALIFARRIVHKIEEKEKRKANGESSWVRVDLKFCMSVSSGRRCLFV